MEAELDTYSSDDAVAAAQHALLLVQEAQAAVEAAQLQLACANEEADEIRAEMNKANEEHARIVQRMHDKANASTQSGHMDTSDTTGNLKKVGIVIPDVPESSPLDIKAQASRIHEAVAQLQAAIDKSAWSCAGDKQRGCGAMIFLEVYWLE